LKALSIIAVFLSVSLIVMVAALTALFSFWSLTTVQPGTATVLGLLFLGAPGAGIAAGAMMAVRMASSRPSSMSGGLLAALALPVGALAGFGGAMAAMDLIYSDRWSNPDSAPAWLPWAPYAAAPLMALVLAAIVLAAEKARA
jgi:hypothetical protein